MSAGLGDMWGDFAGELCAGLQVPVCSSYDLVNTDMVKKKCLK